MVLSFPCVVFSFVGLKPLSNLKTIRIYLTIDDPNPFLFICYGYNRYRVVFTHDVFCIISRTCTNGGDSLCFSLHFYVFTWAASVKCSGGFLPDIMLLRIIEKSVSMENEQVDAGENDPTRLARPNSQL